MTRPELSDREHRLFNEWLSEEFGLSFGPARRDILRARLEPRRVALGFDTFEQLYLHLKFHPDRKVEQTRLLPHLTNNESYFFRESAQLDELRHVVLPTVKAVLEQAGGQEIRLLSGGCAAGEEAYTLAIIVRQSGLIRPPWSVQVTGMDLDPDALGRARAAQYGPNAFRRVEDDLRSRYFDASGPMAWTVKPAIRSTVRFASANLVSPGWWRSLPPQDVAFCRNVLIYFDDQSVARAIDGLYQSLRPGGFLFLGHAESLSRVPTRFVPVRKPGVIYYQRPLDG